MPPTGLPPRIFVPGSRILDLGSWFPDPVPSPSSVPCTPLTHDLPAPRHCRTRAYYGLAEEREDLHTTEGLLRAAYCIAGHAMDPTRCDPALARPQVDALAARIQERAVGASKRARLAHLHSVLFDEEQLAGNQADYYDPENSFLPRVFETRRGIPISLALIYKAVAEAIGLSVEGVGAPGHFLVRVHDEDGPLLLDPFHKGRLLEESEAYALMEGALGHPVPHEDRFLRAVTHAQWLERLLRNLEVIYAQRARPRDAAAMMEMRRMIEGR